MNPLRNNKIPDNWKLLTVDDVKAPINKSIISGPFGSNISSKFFVEKGIPVIRGNNLTTNSTKFVDGGFVFVNEEKAKELNTWATRNDIIFTAAGTIGQVGIIEDNSKYEQYIISNKQLRLTVDETKVLPLFAYYWFSSPEMVSYIQQRNTGSTIPLINLGILKQLPIVVPPLIEQIKIIQILKSLDDKIELNRQMNETLEQIAQAIFKRWFIDFEFPDENGNPYKSSGGEMVEAELRELPISWVVRQFNDLVPVKDGTHDSPKPVSSGYYLITSKHIKGNNIDFSSAYYIDQIEYEEINKRSKVDYLDILITMIGTVGEFLVVRNKDINFAIKNIGLIKSSQQKDLTYYIYLYLHSDIAKEYLRINLQGSTQQYVTLATLRKYPMILPKPEVLNSFNDIVSNLFQQIFINYENIETLIAIRDSLLPKLLTGKIRVPKDI